MKSKFVKTLQLGTSTYQHFHSLTLPPYVTVSLAIHMPLSSRYQLIYHSVKFSRFSLPLLLYMLFLHLKFPPPAHHLFTLISTKMLSYLT